MSHVLNKVVAVCDDAILYCYTGHHHDTSSACCLPFRPFFLIDFHFSCPLEGTAHEGTDPADRRLRIRGDTEWNVRETYQTRLII